MPLAWALIGLIASLLILAWGALQIQLALAAFLNGESVWSKAQKQLVIDLVTYAVNGDRENLSRFNHSYQILEYDRFARDETRKPDFNYVEVEEALRHDNAMRDAVPMVIFAFQYLPNAPYLRDALQAWRSTDESIRQLKQISLELAEKRHSAAWSEPLMIQTMARIATINDEIQPRTELFSSAIAAGAKWVGWMLFASLIVFAALACLLWLRMAQRTLAGIRGSEERYRLLFDSAADAIVMVDEESGAIVDANRMASTWIGRTRKELIGQNFPALFEDGTAFDGRTPAVGKLRSVNGSFLPVEAQSSLAKWGKNIVRQAILRDVSERLAMEQERRIAAEALASVADVVF